jgi:hypothetical protein
LRIGNALFGNANKVGVHIYPDVVHPRPDRRHPRRAAAHKRVNDRIAGLGDKFEQVRQQGHRLDTIVEVAAHIVGLVVRRFALARLIIHAAERQSIRTQFALPVRRFIVGKDGRAHLAIAEGVFGTQPARAPLCDIRRVGLTIRFLAGDDHSLVPGDKARVHLIAQRLGRRQTVRVMPNPNIADFKPGFLQIHRKPVRHIGEAKYSDMSTGFQHPMCLHPDEVVR